MQTDYDNDLQSYFTDMEHLRAIFRNYVSAEKLPKRLIVFHGVGGVGKSSLLRMFRLHCKSEKIPVALASGDDAKSTLDVITCWMEDLKADGVKFSALNKTLESYRAIQAKVEDQAKKSQSKVANLASQAASKTAEAAGGAAVGALIGSVVPGVGTAIGGILGSAVGGMGAEALTDWLRGFLDKSSVDLLLNPTKKLTSDFLEDLAKAAAKKRTVLLLDTYEQMSALEDWVGEVAQKIHPNVLMVIAGRKLPDWQRVWSDWMMNAQVEELKPMTEEVMRDLIQRYYATMRGGEPDPAQVDAIVKFARGLPMVVTSAVQLWVKYGVEDFQSIKAEIVANLVDHLMEGVPSLLIPALEAAGVVRWFDQPILRAVLSKEDVRDVYNELRRFPFVRTRVEGLALHDSVREILDENLRVQDSERHAELHECAAVYFEKRLEKVTGEEAEKLNLELLYHCICSDQNKGVALFQNIAENLVRYRLVDRLRELLNDVNTYQIKNDDGESWREYYDLQLARMQKPSTNAEEILNRMRENQKLTPKLRAYAMCQLAKIWISVDLLEKPEAPVMIANFIEQSNALLSKNDLKKAENYITLGVLYRREGDISKASISFEKAIALYKENGDMYGVATVFQEMLLMYGIFGDWGKMFDARSRGLAEFPDSAKDSIIYSRLYGRFAIGWTEAGRYAEAEQHSQASLYVAKRIGAISNAVGILQHLIVSTGLQEKYEEAYRYSIEVRKIYREFYSGEENSLLCLSEGLVFIRNGNLQKAEELIKKGLKIQGEFSTKLATPRSLPQNLQLLGLLYEILHEFNLSETYYRKCLDYKWIGRHYYECTAFTGLIRIGHTQGDIAAIPPLLAEAEQLAQQYEYNDHLASLRLTQGHLAWESGNQEEAFAFYQRAMIYALRYNRFLLDELLSGRPQGTPLRPIVLYCLERGEEGKKILSALRDWWRTGINDVGDPRPDTISPISKGISLLEAEKLAREREPGAGERQRSVLDQFDTVL